MLLPAVHLRAAATLLRRLTRPAALIPVAVHLRHHHHPIAAAAPLALPAEAAVAEAAAAVAVEAVARAGKKPVSRILKINKLFKKQIYTYYTEFDK